MTWSGGGQQDSTAEEPPLITDGPTVHAVFAAAADSTPLLTRERIDEIDAQLIRLFQERAILSSEISAARLAAGGTRIVLAREREIIRRFRRSLGPLGAELALLILRAGRGSLGTPVVGPVSKGQQPPQ
jgi:chorismate mutase